MGIRLCFRIAAAWAVFYATAAGTMQHIIYRGAKLLQNAVYHMDRQYWAWSRWVYLGLFVLLFAVCCLTLTRRLHSRNLGTLPGRTMTFIMVGYQLSMNIFVNLFNAFSVDSAPRIFTVYSVYDEVTTILLFFLLCEIQMCIRDSVCAALRKRELLKTRHFRQLARKHGENFGKKRENWTVPALLTRFFYEMLFHPGFVPVSKRACIRLYTML